MQIELVLTAATLAVAVVGSIAGIFGMNLNNGHEDSYNIFLVVRSLSTLWHAVYGDGHAHTDGLL